MKKLSKIGQNQEKFCKTGVIIIRLLCGGVFLGSGCSIGID